MSLCSISVRPTRAVSCGSLAARPNARNDPEHAPQHARLRLGLMALLKRRIRPSSTPLPITLRLRGVKSQSRAAGVQDGRDMRAPVPRLSPAVGPHKLLRRLTGALGFASQQPTTPRIPAHKQVSLGTLATIVCPSAVTQNRPLMVT